MHRTDADGNVAGNFTDGDPSPPFQEATVIGADTMNALQNELIHVIETLASITLVKGTNTQLGTALYALFGRLAAANTWTTTNTFDAPVTAPLPVVSEFRAVLSYPSDNGSAVRSRVLVADAASPYQDSLLITTNADWDGTKWVPDVVSGPAELVSFERGAIRLRAITSLGAGGAADFGNVLAEFGRVAVGLKKVTLTGAGPHTSTARVGTVVIQAGTSSANVGNSTSTAATYVFATIQQSAVDATLTSVQGLTTGSGFTVYGNANATANVTVAFQLIDGL